ncbi:hypothetical protein B0H13DRAFT_1917165 [Mycena leptocephala]|nr:hypothetical protein B0H13DRAFT_1917165 [Mycena leptocephala]
MVKQKAQCAFVDLDGEGEDWTYIESVGEWVQELFYFGDHVVRSLLGVSILCGPRPEQGCPASILIKIKPLKRRRFIPGLGEMQDGLDQRFGSCRGGSRGIMRGGTVRGIEEALEGSEIFVPSEIPLPQTQIFQGSPLGKVPQSESAVDLSQAGGPALENASNMPTLECGLGYLERIQEVSIVSSQGICGKSKPRAIRQGYRNPAVSSEEQSLCQAVLAHLEITLVRSDVVHKEQTATEKHNQILLFSIASKKKKKKKTDQWSEKNETTQWMPTLDGSDSDREMPMKQGPSGAWKQIVRGMQIQTIAGPIRQLLVDLPKKCLYWGSRTQTMGHQTEKGGPSGAWKQIVRGVLVLLLGQILDQNLSQMGSGIKPDTNHGTSNRKGGEWKMLDRRTIIYFETDIAAWSVEHKYLGQDRNLIPGDINIHAHQLMVNANFGGN